MTHNTTNHDVLIENLYCEWTDEDTVYEEFTHEANWRGDMVKGFVKFVLKRVGYE